MSELQGVQQRIREVLPASNKPGDYDGYVVEQIIAVLRSVPIQEFVAIRDGEQVPQLRVSDRLSPWHAEGSGCDENCKPVWSFPQ